MSGWKWFLVIWLGLSALVVFVRGVVRSTRTYTGFDAVFGVIEVGFLIWVVVTQL